jgi:hypothetical protein
VRKNNDPSTNGKGENLKGGDAVSTCWFVCVSRDRYFAGELIARRIEKKRKKSIGGTFIFFSRWMQWMCG